MITAEDVVYKIYLLTFAAAKNGLQPTAKYDDVLETTGATVAINDAMTIPSQIRTKKALTEYIKMLNE